MGRHSSHHAGRPVVEASSGRARRLRSAGAAGPRDAGARIAPDRPAAGELQDGRPAALVVRSPGADSIVFESLNGLDRYWSTAPSCARSSPRTSAIARRRRATRFNGETTGSIG